MWTGYCLTSWHKILQTQVWMKQITLPLASLSGGYTTKKKKNTSRHPVQLFNCRPPNASSVAFSHSPWPAMLEGLVVDEAIFWCRSSLDILLKVLITHLLQLLLEEEMDFKTKSWRKRLPKKKCHQLFFSLVFFPGQKFKLFSEFSKKKLLLQIQSQADAP